MSLCCLTGSVHNTGFPQLWRELELLQSDWLTCLFASLWIVPSLCTLWGFPPRNCSPCLHRKQQEWCFILVGTRVSMRSLSFHPQLPLSASLSRAEVLQCAGQMCFLWKANMHCKSRENAHNSWVHSRVGLDSHNLFHQQWVSVCGKLQWWCSVIPSVYFLNYLRDNNPQLGCFVCLFFVFSGTCSLIPVQLEPAVMRPDALWCVWR